MTIYLITGATGMIGSMLVKTLINSKEYIEGNVKIIAIVRNVSKFAKIFDKYNCENVEIIENELNDMGELEINEPIDYIIHCAAATQSSYMISNPVEVADGIVVGTKKLLELARKHNIQSMVFLSSMEVYGTVTDNGQLRSENELGEISLELPRSCYPLAKRMAEHYCHIYSKEYNVPVKIARLAQVFGEGVNLEDNRVYMQFAKAVCNNSNIILKTQGNSIGNYCDTVDVVNAIFTIMEKGAAGQVYNVVNENNTMSIRQMAELVADKLANGQIKVIIEEEDFCNTGYAPDTGLRLSGKKLRDLGWQPTKDIIQMYEDVVEFLPKNS